MVLEYIFYFFLFLSIDGGFRVFEHFIDEFSMLKSIATMLIYLSFNQFFIFNICN